MRGGTKCGRDAWHGSAWPVRYYPGVSSSHRSNSAGPNRSLGSNSRTTRVDLRPRDPGHLFPPSLLQTQQKSSAQQAQGHVVMPSPPMSGSRTRPAPRRSSPSRTRSQCATGSLPRMPGSPTGYPPERWTSSSGVRCRPSSGGRRPKPSRRACASWLPAPAGR